MQLSQLHDQQTAYVVQLHGSPALQLRLAELGFVPGQEVRRLHAAPLGSPIVFAMLGQRVALRRSEAELIDISLERPDQNYAAESRVARPTPEQNFATQQWRLDTQAAPLSCAGGSCAGCTGCAPRKPLGKKQEGTLTIALVGNPNCGKTTVFNAATRGHERTGNYAGVTVSSIVGETTFLGRPLRIVDLPGTYSLQAYSPEEAYVMQQLQTGEIDVIVNVLDVNNLERNLLLTLQLRDLGVPMVGVLNMYDEFEESQSQLDIERLSEHMGMPFVRCVASRGQGIAEALRLAIEQDAQRDNLPEQMAHDQHSTADLHALAHHYLADCYQLNEGRAVRLSERIDRWMVSRVVGYVAFLAVMWIVFQATFTLGQWPMDWIDGGVAALGEALTAWLSEGLLRDLLVDGALGGVGAVIVFLPNILILYFFISLLEDSGYLARAALLFDPILRRVGLHGKSFFPMLTGFGCNVPAVMATRTIESRKARLLTMLTLPFMSCSARLPVYVVFTAAFFPESAGTVMFLLYAGGILAAYLSAWALSQVLQREAESHFVMELPPYRFPIWLNVLRNTWEKGRQYLRKMGGLILFTSILVWALGAFPRTEGEVTAAQQQEQSYLGKMGHAMQPLIAPLGMDWRMGVGILTGAGAKELMVSTLGVLYDIDPETAAAAGSGDDAAADTALSTALRAATTPAAGLAYIVFALLYFPCVATIVAIKNESGRWRYALLSAAYSTALAYVAAWVAYLLASA